MQSVSLPIRQGEVLALIGPSGCGKTTLLRSLNRLTELTRDASSSGRITLDGVDIASMEPTALRRRVTMVFQQPNPFPMSVFDNVAYVLREQAKRRPKRDAVRGAVQEALARAGLLDEVADDLDHPALRLSGGQQQRLCIARALAADPEVLLLDEPCSALDPQSTKLIEELIGRLREDVAVVIVTHNLQQAYRIADYVAFMYLGEMVEYGERPDDLRFAPRAANQGVRERCVRVAGSARRSPAWPRADSGAAHRLRDDAAGRLARTPGGRTDPREPEPAARDPPEPRRAGPSVVARLRLRRDCARGSAAQHVDTLADRSRRSRSA